MSEQLIHPQEMAFQLYELLDTEALCQRERFAEHSRDTFDAILDTADKIASEKFAPHNAVADQQEPTFDGHKVTMIDEVKVAFDAFRDAGFIAGRYDFDDGGMQLPETVMTACSGYFLAANPSTTGYPFLTAAAANVICHFASDELKQKFMPRMLTGDFTGTMALTEPHAGSSLADIRTMATPHEDGSYRIKGSKIYISGGEHELSDNIVHLVLAKTPGAPEGVKGISLFIVPKYRLDENDQPGQRNDVSLAGLIHKMGYRGTTSTALSFGDDDDCHGYLIGKRHEGLKYMFMMMNEARIGVGYGAAMIGYRGYRYAVEYAKERVQGRKPGSKDPVAIIEHGDVRRMLLAQKAYCEGGMALCFYGARLVDDLATLEDSEAKVQTRELLDLLTPVCKAWPSEYGPKANDLAIQVLGGAGYTREYPVEQYWRDNRLNPIHEGTNGIQALDLMARKLWQANSLGLAELKKRILQDMENASGQVSGRLRDSLSTHLPRFERCLPVIAGALQSDKLHPAMANAQGVMNAFSHLVIGWMWMRQAMVAEQALAKDDLNAEQQNFYQGKCQAANYYASWELPTIERDFQLIESMDTACSDMRAEWF